MEQKYKIREMKIEDYDLMMNMWENMSGVGLSESDSRENILKYLKRNPGLSFVCENGNEIIGTILSGHDGRRGYIYHLAVQKDYRKQGIARRLLSSCLNKLREEKILKCHIFVFRENEIGVEFWDNIGWTQRDDLYIFSKELN